MRYLITHRTEYEYSEIVSCSHNEARLLPRSSPSQICHAASIRVVPEPIDYSERADFFGNRAAYFFIGEPHKRFCVVATSEVEVIAARQMDFSNLMQWESARDCLTDSPDALQYALDSPYVERSEQLAAYAQPSFSRERPLIDAVNDLMRRIHVEFTYDPGFTTLATPLSEVMSHRRGVCQDFAHLAIGCLRSMGLAARYVSGYIETLPAPGCEKLIGADASHAWFSVHVPEHGWMDFDPTNNQVPSERHIVLAWGRDYGDVAPLKGVIFGGGEHELDVSVDVRAIVASS